MKHQRKAKPSMLLILLLLAFVLLGQNAFAQQQQKAAAIDTSRAAKTDTIKAPPAIAPQETVLDPIKIEALVEKPSVTLIPKRAQTDVGQLPFGNRSFDKELKEKPKILSDYGKELESTKRIKELKKLLAKEKK